MSLKFKYQKENEIPEDLRSFYSEQNGAWVLDVDGVETAKASGSDEAVRYKRLYAQEQAARQALEEKLEAYSEIGEADDIRGRLEELENLKDGGKTSNEELLKYKRDYRQLQREFDTYKKETSPKLEELEGLRQIDRRNKIRTKLKDVIQSAIDPKYDKNRLQEFAEDFADNLQLDELGEIAPYKGKQIKEYLESRAEMYNFQIPTVGGRSNPGGAPPAPAEGAGDLISEMAAGLKG